jgi:hypothetical protein
VLLPLLDDLSIMFPLLMIIASLHGFT